jgi:hypothetical protein
MSHPRQIQVCVLITSVKEKMNQKEVRMKCSLVLGSYHNNLNKEKYVVLNLGGRMVKREEA